MPRYASGITFESGRKAPPAGMPNIKLRRQKVLMDEIRPRVNFSSRIIDGSRPLFSKSGRLWREGRELLLPPALL